MGGDVRWEVLSVGRGCPAVRFRKAFLNYNKAQIPVQIRAQIIEKIDENRTDLYNRLIIMV